MSRAYGARIEEIRKRLKKVRTPEEAKFMSIFGATDLYNSYSSGLDELSSHNPAMQPQDVLNVPLPMTVPMSLDEIPLLPGSEHREIQPAVRGTAVPVLTGHAVPALESGVIQNEDINQGTDTEVLVEFLEGMGQKVQEVKGLPAGVTRITVADLIGAQKVREPELVEAGGR